MEIPIAILMADLSGYTALAEVHGSQTALTFVEHFMDIVNQSLVGSSLLHERVGDQVVIVSSSAEDLAWTTLFLFQHAHEQEKFLAIHAGLHYGPVIEKLGNYFGATMNITARIMANAERGIILCSREFVQQLPSTHPFTLNFLGQRLLKNLIHPIDVFELSYALSNISAHYVIDPVCHMLIKDPQNSVQLAQGEQTQYFCSERCRDIFMKLHMNN